MRQGQRRVVLVCSFVDKNYLLVSLEEMWAVKKMSAKIDLFGRLLISYKHNLSTKPFGYFSSCLGLFQMLSWTPTLQIQCFNKNPWLSFSLQELYFVHMLSQFSRKKSISIPEPAHFRSAVTERATLWKSLKIINRWTRPESPREVIKVVPQSNCLRGCARKCYVLNAFSVLVFASDSF